MSTFEANYEEVDASFTLCDIDTVTGPDSDATFARAKGIVDTWTRAVKAEPTRLQAATNKKHWLSVAEEIFSVYQAIE